MSLLRQKTTITDRPYTLIKLKLVDKLGLPIDPSAAWLALQDAFKGHKHLEVFQAEIGPDRGSSVE